MSILVSVPEFKVWSGAGMVPDMLIQACLDEAEASIVADLGAPIPVIRTVPEAESVAYNETLRRAQRFLARRNSPEGLAGAGDLGFIQIPTRDPDSQYAIWRLQALLAIPEGIA